MARLRFGLGTVVCSRRNNLGHTDQPTLAFTIASYAVDTDDGPAWTGRV